MSAPRDAVVRARELVAKATSGKWRAWHNEFGDLSGYTVSGSKSEGIAVIVGHVGQDCAADAALIAAAPALLTELADECERLRAENEHLRLYT